MKAGFIQFTPLFGETERNLLTIERLVGGLEADLIVLPELCTTGYLFTSRQEAKLLGEEIPAGRTVQALGRMAIRTRAHIVAGMIERAGDRLFNAAVLVGPGGHVATYRKLHLFCEETLWFDPGDREPAVHDIGPCRVGMMICFDWLFPETARVLALAGADILCHPANLVLPFCQDAMVTRCLENRVAAVTANRTGAEARGGKELRFTGKSQLTGADGTILCRAGAAAEEAGAAEIDVARSRDKGVNPYNDLLGDRRPEWYGSLVKPRPR